MAMEMDGTLNADVFPSAVDAVGNLNGDGEVGGASLSPISILLIVFSLQALDAFLEILKKRGSSSMEQAQMRQEIQQLLKEASSLSTPSTFAQAAKLRRMAAAKEKELLKKQEEQSKESKSSNDLYARALLVIKVLLYAGLCWHFWGVPVAVVPRHLLQPMGGVLSLTAKKSAPGLVLVGIFPWLVVTSRVSKFLCQKISKVVAAKKIR